MNKKRILFFFKVLLTIIILYMIFRKIHFIEVVSLIGQLSFLTFILLFVTTILKTLTQFLNWELCLNIHSNNGISRAEMMKTLFIGSALRFVMPGGYASFGKIFFIDQSKKKTLVSVGLEKFILTWSIWLFGSWAAFFHFSAFPLWGRMVLVAVITLTPLIIYMTRNLFKGYTQYFDRCLKIVPLMTFNQAVYLFFTAFQYFIIIYQFLCLQLVRAVLVVPLILIANTIPVTYSGLGLRESFSMHILAEYGVPAEVAVMTSLLIFFFNAVIPALLGTYFIASSSIKKKSDRH